MSITHHRPTSEFFKGLVKSKAFSNCRGCDSAKFIGTTSECLFLDAYKHNIEGMCPCTSCIIKPMCSDACPKFQKSYISD